MNIPQGKKELALRYVRENQREHAMSCSESVFNALVRSGVIAVQEDWTRIATGLSGGVAASGNTCGAVCGGLMALGWAITQQEGVTGPEGRGQARRWYNSFVNEMQEKMGGTVCCGDLIRSSGGYFNDKRVMKCPDIMVLAVETALRYLEMPEEERRALPFGENVFGLQ